MASKRVDARCLMIYDWFFFCVSFWLGHDSFVVSAGGVCRQKGGFGGLLDRGTYDTKGGRGRRALASERTFSFLTSLMFGNTLAWLRTAEVRSDNGKCRSLRDRLGKRQNGVRVRVRDSGQYMKLFISSSSSLNCRRKVKHFVDYCRFQHEASSRYVCIYRQQTRVSFVFCLFA